MKPLVRRRLDAVLVVLAAVTVGVVAAIGGAVGDSERVAVIRIEATLADDGSISVHELIDYDFGQSRRRGIFRDIDNVRPDSPIEVSSPTAPDEFVTFDQSSLSVPRTRVRIGDPNRTISGRHRYSIEFELEGLAAQGVLAWDVIGTDWDVAIERAEVRFVSMLELSEINCVAGAAGSWGECDVRQVAPNTINISTSRLGPGDGVTLYAKVGAPAGDPIAATSSPVDELKDPGSGIVQLGLIGFVAALTAAIPSALAIRRLGRERIRGGGSVNAAFATSVLSSAGTYYVDHGELEDLATVSFAPPTGLSAVEGGVVFAESVSSRLMTAWLFERVNAGELVLEGAEKELALLRGPEEADANVSVTLNKMFGSRDRIDLSRYDKQFASGWTRIERQLTNWQSGSPLWERRGRRTQTRVRVGAAFAGVFGLALAAGGGATSARWGLPWPLLLVTGALLAGAAGAAILSSWELLVRSPAGSAMWLQIESFRRFLEGSETTHVESAARAGRLREYTAWAVALDETDAWTDLVDRATLASPEFGRLFRNDIYLVHSAHNLHASTSTASTSPRSSGSSFGGSVGGGGGGGGGGSW